MLKRLSNYNPEKPPKWLMSLEELMHHSPSRADGFSFEQENTFRVEGIQFIALMVSEQMIRLNRTFVVPTSYMYFHRYYAKISMRGEYERSMICLAALFLACKVEDTLRSAQDLIHVYRIAKTKLESKSKSSAITAPKPDTTSDLPRLSSSSQEYMKLKESLVRAERHLIQVLCFDFMVVHPIRYVEVLVKLALENRAAPQDRIASSVADSKINIVESMFTVVGLLYPPEDIAAACVFFNLQMKHSDILQDVTPWLDRLGVTREHLDDILRMIAKGRDSIHHRPPEATHGQANITSNRSVGLSDGSNKQQGDAAERRPVLAPPRQDSATFKSPFARSKPNDQVSPFAEKQSTPLSSLQNSTTSRSTDGSHSGYAQKSANPVNLNQSTSTDIPHGVVKRKLPEPEHEVAHSANAPGANTRPDEHHTDPTKRIRLGSLTNDMSGS
eukprot:TRINITY_DN2944_c0_g2_i3.p1 TRINITY_DN2944_c0_g2~~TRINITY_DN2944_c0_g2_i3.p1  ORF type:complete len:443 (-),score=77.87 TRINITY_DN2944_c0_g2_i3:331-1659(-)